MFRWHVVSAVFWRNVKQYFSGPLGYLFIVVFVTVCAVMAFSPQFFADNLANLDQLSNWFPVLLLFFIPAITMNVWAEERQKGTDSILFTLPASDFDILLGKFLSVVAVYTVALAFSLTQVVVLEVLGSPDWGVICTTYVGYWLSGVALLAVGMLASSLTSSATVAFVLGSLFCAIPVLIGYYFRGVDWAPTFYGAFEEPAFRFPVDRLGFDWNLRDFTLGLIPLSNIIYFLALTVFMLYLNLVQTSKRHWRRGQHASLGGHFVIRTVALGVGLVAVCFLSSSAISSIWSRLDLTAEKLYTLEDVTQNTLKKIRDADREVTIQAFISKDVPRTYVNAKKQFVGLLRQFSESGGKNISVRYVDVEPNSQAAIDARQMGIEPVDDRSEIAGRFVEQEVFLGAAVSTSIDDVALPFVGDDAAIEYELSRSIASTIDKENQIELGIVSTDAHFGGPEIEGRRIPWSYQQTLEELKKQFKIKHIDPQTLGSYVSTTEVAGETGDGGVELKKSKVKKAPTVLLVADPSSLDDTAADNLVKYIEDGHPTILLTDPLPFFWTFQNPINIGVLNAPMQARVSQQSPYSQILSSSVLPKSDNGSATKIMNSLGLAWDHGSAAWSNDDPHPSFKPASPDYLGVHWPEYYGPQDKALVFVRNLNEHRAFNGDDLISDGLKEVLFFYPGSIRKSASSKLEFTPLVTLPENSGSTAWDQLTKTPQREQRMLDPRTGQITTTREPARSQITMAELRVMEPFPQTYPDDDEKVIAARVSGEKNGKQINTVVIADMDFVSDLFYEQQEALGEKLDNLSLLQNAIEILAGNDGFVSLRNRRATPRTLSLLEDVFSEYREDIEKEQAEAEKKVREELEKEQAKLDEANKEIQTNEELGFFEKLQKTSQQASNAQRRFDLKQRKLDRELKIKTDELNTKQKQQISWIENLTRYASILSAPLPALLLGIIVLWVRRLNEDKHISSDRRV